MGDILLNFRIEKQCPDFSVGRLYSFRTPLQGAAFIGCQGDQPEFSEPPLKLEGNAYHWNYREDDDDYFTQPGLLFRLMGSEKQALLFGNTARAIADAPKAIKIRHIGNCLQADPDYGKGVAKAIGIPLSEVAKKK